MVEAALSIAVASLLVAIWAGANSRGSRVAAERSAKAAEESATTARQALEIQRQEAAAGERERGRLLQADVVPVKWESRASQEHMGLVVTNRGPGTAKDVRAECLVANLYRGGNIASLMAGQTAGIKDNLKDFHPTEDAGELPDRADGEYVARAMWTNEDGSRSETPWTRIERI